MSERHLGETFDIHGGGLDLIFPHHENEIAQSTCAHGGRPFVRWWLHNGFVTVEGEKMSKSLGNFVTVRQLLDAGAEGEAIRLAMLTGHYRDPLDWTRERLRQAKETLDRFYNALADLEDIEVAGDEDAEPPEGFLAALLDDLNTPLALSVLHETVRSLNMAIQGRKGPQAARLAGEAKAAGALLGILGAPPLDWMQAGVSATERQRIEALIAERDAARRAKDFARADALRGELTALGVAVKDRRNLPTKWTRAL
jgi:cysteinyl-tRNA synthetase